MPLRGFGGFTCLEEFRGQGVSERRFDGAVAALAESLVKDGERLDEGIIRGQRGTGRVPR
jgi:hypothetical protein